MAGWRRTGGRQLLLLTSRSHWRRLPRSSPARPLYISRIPPPSAALRGRRGVGAAATAGFNLPPPPCNPTHPPPLPKLCNQSAAVPRIGGTLALSVNGGAGLFSGGGGGFRVVRLEMSVGAERGWLGEGPSGRCLAGCDWSRRTCNGRADVPRSAIGRRAPAMRQGDGARDGGAGAGQSLPPPAR